MLLTSGMSTPEGTPTRSSRQGSPRIVKDIEVIYFPPIQFLLFASDYKALEDSILDFVTFLIFCSFFFVFFLIIVFCVTKFRYFKNLPNYSMLHAISRFWCYLLIVCLLINPNNFFFSCAWVLFSACLFAFCGWIVIAF